MSQRQRCARGLSRPPCGRGLCHRPHQGQRQRPLQRPRQPPRQPQLRGKPTWSRCPRYRGPLRWGLPRCSVSRLPALRSCSSSHAGGPLRGTLPRAQPLGWGTPGDCPPRGVGNLLWVARCGHHGGPPAGRAGCLLGRETRGVRGRSGIRNSRWHPVAFTRGQGRMKAKQRCRQCQWIRGITCVL